MPEENVKTSLRLPAELHWEFKRVAAERRVSDTEAVRLAIRHWIESPPVESSGNVGDLTPQEQDLTGRLVHLLREGNPEIAAMVRNLLASQPAQAELAKNRKLG